MLLHMIGPHQFHGMRGTPDYPQAVIDIETRFGVDGATLWDEGKQGQPFDLETTRFAANYRDALNIFGSYKAAPALGPLILTIGSQTIAGGKFQVLNVRPLMVERIVRGLVPGDATIYQGKVVAQWTLYPVAD